MSRSLTRFAAAVVLTAAAYAGVPSASASPAPAAACADADGVTVVVDFHDLGGGLQQTCDGDGGGRDAASLFVRAGYELTPVQRQPAFVCRINGVPADDPCVNTPPADAYWTLWWSDGTDGRWSYSTVAASGLKIPEGGSVAFSWNRGSGQDKPGVAPGAHAAASPTPTQKPRPTPRATPTPKPTPQASTTPTAATAPATGSPSAAASSADPSPTPTRGAKPTKPTNQTQSPSPTSSATSVSPAREVVVASADPLDPTTPAGSSTSSLPLWSVLIVIGGLFAGAAAIAVARRRRARSRLVP